MSLVVLRAVYSKKTCREQRVKVENNCLTRRIPVRRYLSFSFFSMYLPSLPCPAPPLLPSVSLGGRPRGKCGQPLPTSRAPPPTTTPRKTPAPTKTPDRYQQRVTSKLTRVTWSCCPRVCLAVYNFILQNKNKKGKSFFAGFAVVFESRRKQTNTGNKQNKAVGQGTTAPHGRSAPRGQAKGSVQQILYRI